MNTKKKIDKYLKAANGFNQKQTIPIAKGESL
jgi:hypothetical protein